MTKKELLLAFDYCYLLALAEPCVINYMLLDIAHSQIIRREVEDGIRFMYQLELFP